MLPVGGPAPEARPAGIPAAGPEPASIEPASSDAVQVAPAADLPTVEPVPSALPADVPEVGPESSNELAAEAPVDPDPGFSWPAAPDHGSPLLGDRPIATAMPTAATPAVQRSAVDEVVPVRWGDPPETGHAGPGPRGPSGSSPHVGQSDTGPQQGHSAAVQRSVGAPSATPAGSTAGAAAGAPVQRAVASGSGGDPGSVAVHAGLAQRAADGSVVFHPPSDGPAASLQRFGLPSMPKMPSVPSLPSMPSMPSLPSVPSLPSMPTLPNMPSGLPNMPGMPSGLPSLPNLPPGLPALPNMPGLPSGLPSLPNVPGIPSGLPSLPGMPSMPGVPDLPSMPGAVDEIRDRAGSAVSTASDAVSGAVGQAADTATGALGQAADTASGAVGQAVDAAKGAVGQATGAAGALAAASTDELVRRLFDPLAARLKAELRLDRERAGFVTDLRREGETMADDDPAVSVCFSVTIDDNELGTFISCEGLGVEVVLEQREEGG